MKATRASIGNCSPAFGFSQEYSNGWDAAMKVIAQHTESNNFNELKKLIKKDSI